QPVRRTTTREFPSSSMACSTPAGTAKRRPSSCCTKAPNNAFSVRTCCHSPVASCFTEIPDASTFKRPVSRVGYPAARWQIVVDRDHEGQHFATEFLSFITPYGFEAGTLATQGGRKAEIEKQPMGG